MAYFRKYGNGFWRAEVEKLGVRDSKTFVYKRDAEIWAAQRETEILSGVANQLADPGLTHTLTDALRAYTEKVSPMKKGARWELVRAEAFIASGHTLFSLPMAVISPDDLGDWGRWRLGQVSAGTVIRDFNFLSAVFETARREWHWIAVNPVHDVRKPREPDHRERVIAWSEIRLLLKALRFCRGPVRSVSHAVAVCWLVALRTGMRAGELCGLHWDDLNVGFCKLRDSKTGPRQVPLSRKAMRAIKKMEGYDPEMVFGLSSQSLDANFRKYRKRAGLEGFTFHDSRHTAATMLAGRLKSDGIPAQQAVLNMCKIFGWKNVNQALTYFNPTAAEIAAQMG